MTPAFRNRTRWGLPVAGLVLVLGGALARAPLARWALHQRLPRLAAVGVEQVEAALDGSPRDRDLLQRLWESGRVASRRAAALALVRRKDDPGLQALLTPWRTEAARDPDLALRDLLLGVRTDPPDLMPLGWQLADADPECRRQGLRLLRHQGSAAQAGWVLPLLGDPDPTVALLADATLRHWSGIDSGLRLSEAVPPAHHLAEPVLSEDVAARLGTARQRWSEWMRTNGVPTGVRLPEPPPTIRPPVEDFELAGPAGVAVRLSDYRGRRVLLNFWATWCPGCLAEFPVLTELQRRHPDDLVILGISLDSPATTPGLTGRAALPDRVAGVARRHRLNYPVLLDPDATVGGRFDGGELPTQVLIDRDGRLHRRFLGGRTLEVWEILLRETDAEASPPAAPGPAA